MWAQVDNNSVVKVFTRPQAFSIGDNNYPANTMSVWPEAELNALDIWEIVEDKTNFKDPKYYTNTNVIHTYNSGTGKVDATWGTAAAKNLDDDAKYITIKSPIIGTFYRKSAPDKPNFTEVGSKVNVGDTVCIIEAMKLFNEIESEVSGTIVKVLVDDSSPVEFDQPLFLVDPS